MKRVNEIRQHLQSIPGAFAEFDPEETHRGSQAAIKVLWEPLRQDDKATEAFNPGLSEELEGETGGSAQVEELFELGAEIDSDLLHAAMNGADGERIRKAVLTKGIDALGWYVPFHAKGVQWGIYVPASGLAYLIANIFADLPVDLPTRLLIAFRAIHQHELFHFATDYMAGKWEAITGKACFIPARSLRDKNLGYNLLEEECANAHMLRSFLGGRSALKVAGRMNALRKFVKSQPPGYRDGDHKLASRFRERCDELSRDYIGCIVGFEPFSLTATDLFSLYPPLFPNLDWTYVPIHIVNDGVRFGIPTDLLGLLRSVQAFEESERFQRKLTTLPPEIRHAWERAKQRMRSSVVGKGLDFKQWDRDADGVVYSVRLSRNHRAHLRHVIGAQRWIALDVGTHSQMDHG